MPYEILVSHSFVPILTHLLGVNLKNRAVSIFSNYPDLG